MKPYKTIIRAALFAVAFLLINPGMFAATLTDTALPAPWVLKLEEQLNGVIQNAQLLAGLGLQMGPRIQAQRDTLQRIASLKSADGSLTADNVARLKQETAIIRDRYYMYATWFPVDGKPNTGFMQYANGYAESITQIEYVQDRYEASLTLDQLAIAIAPPPPPVRAVKVPLPLKAKLR